MPGGLEDRVFLVTGAGAGIGRATALRLAGAGARVEVTDVDPEAARATATAAGAAARAGVLDIRDPGAFDRAVDAALARHGRLDGLVNNAAIVGGGALADVDDEGWREVMSGTLDGTFRGLRAALRVMRPAGRGVIVNVSSGAALGGEVGLGAYGAAKAAVVNLTRTAAVENAAAGIRVCCVLPGPIETDSLRGWLDTIASRETFERQIPQGRLGRPDEIAAVIAFLCSDDASYVNGAAWCVDGAVSARTSSPRPEFRSIEFADRD